MKNTLGYLILCFLCPGIFAATCGYESCPKGNPEMLNIHLICHTHDDVGWLHTVDTYYDMWVKDIITSVVINLVQNEQAKFSYVETSFFSKWWEQQTDLVREYVRRLVNDGQLEFLSGGWCMNDEATTHYLAIIDQMTLGLRWLNETFGTCATPRVGWQIDTFGHSKHQAALLAQMYFDGQFIGRVHYQDKFWREKTNTMEFVWQSSESLRKKGNLFTGVLPNVYWPPREFCFDVFCSDEELTEENIHIKGHRFIALAEEQAKNYASNHIAMTMGMDFYYRDASKWFRNLNYLIQHINSLQAVGMKINVFYSSPSCYLHSLNSANVTWPTYKHDFFPYASKQHEYWTGYFTSRPSLKYYSRKSSSFFQACKQLAALSNLEYFDVSALAKALAIVQHHDGITGTEKQHVAVDYIRKISYGMAICENIVSNSLKRLVYTAIVPGDSQEMHFHSNTNTSQCHFTERETDFFVIVYNSLGQEIDTFARLPVVGEGYNITKLGSSETLTSAQVIPIPLSVLNLSERSSLAQHELVFPLKLPPLGVSLYRISVLQGYQPVTDIGSSRIFSFVQDAVIRNEYFQVKIDWHSGLMKELRCIQTGLRLHLQQSFYYYEGMPGYRIERASGAYAFNPQYDAAFPLGENVTYRIFKGNLVEEVHQYFAPWISQVIRLYKGQKFVEFDWVVGPIPIHDHIGREIISRFDSNLFTNGTFYTDSNARETVKRVRNYQDGWPWNITEQVAGNYYPVTSFISLQDTSKDVLLSIFTDRAEGGSSITDGSLELMVHRRLLFDDGFGVNEALNELGHDGRGLVARGTHYLTLGSTKDIRKFNKQFAKQIFYKPIFSFMKYNPDLTVREFQGLSTELPTNIHILTLEKIGNTLILLRLEHYYESSDEDNSQPVTLSLLELFTPFDVIAYFETTLSANQYLIDIDKLVWNYQNDESFEDNNIGVNQSFDNETNGEESDFFQRARTSEPFEISLNPMEIRTFVVKVSYRYHV